ncbi:Neurogenic locus notch protein [Echinococcus granulosus]|uniref:Neurogenic locus notch protein n=1 Tax=Echinococcus granulosus TaxID=6210 RepID=W6UG53_ECHGR|nr:Neurogenic locus notch protein [Echinococcus granulosus]EUB57117.1 Neurogenic locus notch protein [Echinococcus granulosus]
MFPILASAATRLIDWGGRPGGSGARLPLRTRPRYGRYKRKEHLFVLQSPSVGDTRSDCTRLRRRRNADVHVRKHSRIDAHIRSSALEYHQVTQSLSSEWNSPISLAFAMHERRALWSFLHLLPLLLFLLQPSYGDYVVKEVAEPGRYLNLLDKEMDLRFERDAEGEEVGSDFLFVRLDSTYGGPFAHVSPMDLSSNDSLTSQMIMPSGEMFPWYSTIGLFAQPTPVETRSCPWNTSACPRNEVYLRFNFLLVEDVDRTVGERDPFNLVTVEPHLRVDYEPASGIVRASWANHVISEACLPGGISDWTTVEVVVKPDTGEMDLAISTPEGEWAFGNIRVFVGPQVLPSSLPPAGIHVGPTNHTRRVLTAVSVANEEMTILKRSRRNVYSYERGANVSVLNFEGTNGFVRYDFRNRIKLPRLDAEVGREEVALDFAIKPGVTSGLLWFAEGTASKSFIIIKDSKLYYKYIEYDETHGAKRILTEEIVINETLEPGKTHRLRLNRYQDVLRLSLGTQQRFRKIVSGKAPLIPENGVIYIGGSDNAAISTDGEVARNFDGSVTVAKITQEGSGISNLNMLELIRDPNWTRDVLRKGDVQYEYHMPFRPSPRLRPKDSSLLMPTASTRGHAGITLHTSPMPVTFMGTQSSVVRFDTWDFSVFHSFEIEFRTFEPNGVLFFVGPDREHTDFVCVELFDGNVYFAYGIGDHYRHIQLNPTSRKVNTGTAHRVYVERTPQHRFIVKYNGQEIDVDQGTSRHQAEFSSYTYFGSIDQPSRFPWIVWSRENFAGCINFIRVNDDKFLDPASRMNQHTDLSRGIQFGVCKAPDLRCNREICGGGQCHEQSYPFFEPMNFACDCSASDKTFREGVEDIRRSEACNRDAPIVDFDGETVIMIDFERQMNTLTTHTDDINLQFKTDSLYAPLFVAVSTAEKQYFRVELENGLIKVSTNMNKASKPPRDAVSSFTFVFDRDEPTMHFDGWHTMRIEFLLQSPRLNDNNWHTLRIRRRAQFLYISVDNASENNGVLVVEIPKGVFNNIAQQIYVGGPMPENYASPPYGNMAGFLPKGSKFVGEMRNFYWNQYDFFGTRQLPTHYTTDVLTPRLELPTFPSWPREPIYSITCTSKLNWGTIQVPMKAKEAGDMWLLEFKTKYDGVLAHARDENTGSHFTLMILKGRLHLIYSIGGVTGVHEIINSPISVADNRWHRVTFGLDRVKGRFVIIVDDSAPETFGHRLQHNTLNSLTFGFGGVPGIWSKILEIIRLHAPTSLPSGYEGSPPALTGCLGGFSTRTDRFLVDLLKKYDTQLESYPTGEIIRGYCRGEFTSSFAVRPTKKGNYSWLFCPPVFLVADLVRCTPDYCLHGGVCTKMSETLLHCDCTNTGYTGLHCEDRVTTCPRNYCLNGGICTIVGTNPVCNCQGTGYYGDRSRCDAVVCRPNYCRNGGICSIQNGRPVCSCSGTGYDGLLCEQPICRPGYCSNGGICRIQGGSPICDCSGTDYDGKYCENPICRPGYCQNGGRCVVENGLPVCECRGTGYGGSRCDQPICTPSYCQNGGRCILENGRPVCDCRGTGYGGSRCDRVICPPDYCQNGGRCVVENGRPLCDCRGTEYGGSRCDQAICPPNYCLNGGRCIVRGGQPVCDCTSTRYQGRVCEVPICRPDFCLNGGQCIVQGDRAVCDCRGTNHEGINCETPICRPGYCMNGGICTIVNGRPACDCSNTGYGGQLCEQPICRPGFCLNSGRCIVQNGQAICDCRDTGFVGQHCEQSICRLDYCMNGGICSVINGQPVCDCRDTGYGGPLCEQSICPDGFCLNGGRCTVQNGRPVCDCSGTDYRGDRCSHPICPPNFCLNGGVCYVYDGNPRCNCTGNFGGDRCHYPVCPPGYCLNNGRCFIRPGSSAPECDCTGTGFTDDRCSSPVCPEGYCLNGGVCRALPNRLPFCDCSYTSFTGDKCEVPICSPDYCSGHGTCRVEQGRPVCECHLEYWGPQCQLEVCPPGFCHHSGTCYPGPDRRPHCRCPEGYEGDQCEMPKTCPPGYCYHGGECTMQSGMPVCNCINTDYQGPRCETPKTCPPGYCQNGGLCTVSGGRYTCNCLATGFQGPTCSDPIACPPGYCHGGICTVLPGGRYVCNCWKTGLSGPTCDGDVNGIYIDYEKIGYMVYDLNPPLKTKVDNVTVGFKTYAQSGTILDFVTTTGAHWGIKVRNGHIVIDRNGQEYMYPNVVNDGAYHVVSVERKGDRMLVTFDNDQIASLKGVTRASLILLSTSAQIRTRRTSSMVLSVVSLYWNGRYPVDEAKGGLQIATGDVIYVLLPSFILPGKKPVPVCPADYCFNGGVCYVEDYELKCDCRLTGWQGSRCEKPTHGVLPSTSGNGAYVIIKVVPPKLTNLDRMRVAFQTYATDGPIARFMLSDGRFYEIYMKGQQVFVSNSKDEIRLISAPYQQCDDAKMHVITLVRNGSRFDWSVDGHRIIYVDKSLVDSNGALITNELILGADRKFTHSFNGVLGAFDWNGQLLVNDNGELSPESNVMIVPGRGVGKKEDVVIVVMPHFMQPPLDTTAAPPLPFPPLIPPDGIQGGAIVGGAGEGSLFVPSMGYGGGASGVFAGSGPLLLQAGGAGFFGLINPWLAGILVCLLPLISALIWACWRCKPGFCPCCIGGAGGKTAGGKFHDTMDRISAGLWAPPPADKGLLVSSKPLLVSFCAPCCILISALLSTHF